MKLRHNVKGLDQVLAKFRDAPQKALQISEQVLYQEATNILEDSQENYVPHKEGTLKRSGFVALPHYSLDRLTVAIGYGGGEAFYARYVHNINKNYRNGKVWKYLKTPLNKHLPKVQERLLKELSEALK